MLPTSTYKGPIDMSINNTQQGADLVNANKEQAAKLGITLPGSTYTPPTTGQTTLAQDQAKAANQGKAGYDVFGNPIQSAPTSTAAPTQTTDQQKLSDAQAQRDANAQEFYTIGKQASDAIASIQSGATPLTAAEQAQIDGLKAQFDKMIDEQLLTNKGAEGSINVRGFQKGAAEYDPKFHASTVKSIIDAGAAKVADLQVKEAAAVAQLTQAFRDNDIKGIQSAWNIYKDAAEQRQKQLQETIKDAQEAIKTAAEEKAAAEKQYFDQVTKPINDLATDAAKNGAPASVIKAMQGAGNVSEAIAKAGNYLQTGSGDIGAYLFAMRQAQNQGKPFADFDTWQKELDQKKLDSEIAKLRATEGEKFKYALALEKAKKQLKGSSGNTDYNGEFEATIKLASQAGTTNAQRDQIKSDLQDFIASGDYKSAYTQILSSASAKLTGANASNFQQQQQSYESLKEMRDALIEYRDLGGDTNLFKGGVDKIQTKIGFLATDPKYAAIAVRLNSAFQQYRQNMTGAAFGAKESAEYASVLPSSGNTFALNMAKLDGAEAYLNSVVESTIKNTVGEGGIYIKQYAEAGGAVEAKQQAAMDKLTEFRAADPRNNDLVAELYNAGLSLDQVMEELQL